MKTTSGVAATQAVLGTMTMGRQCSEEEAHKQLDFYVEHGGNFIDTAEVYPVPQHIPDKGKTEEIIGRWLAKKTPQFRQGLFIATKIAGPTSGLTQEDGSIRQDLLEKRAEVLGVKNTEEGTRFTASQLRTACAASLKKLQTTYIDLYQLHWPDRPVPLWGKSFFEREMNEGVNSMRGKKQFPPCDVEEVVLTLGELIKEGKIKTWGLSNETPYGITIYCETAKRLNVPLPVSLQQDYSLCDRRYETSGLLEVCSAYGMKLLIYGPLCGGSLSGKYLSKDGSGEKRAKTEETKNSRHELFPKFQSRYHSESTLDTIAKYDALAKECKLSLIQLAFGFYKSRWYHPFVIVGANTVAQLREDLDAMKQNDSLSKEVLAKIDLIYMEKKDPLVSL